MSEMRIMELSTAQFGLPDTTEVILEFKRRVNLELVGKPIPRDPGKSPEEQILAVIAKVAAGMRAELEIN